MIHKPHYKSALSCKGTPLSGVRFVGGIICRFLAVLGVGVSVFLMVGPGCGELPERTGTAIDDDDIDDYSDAAVTHPDEGEFESSEAEPGSYLVTFRTNQTFSGLHFSSFRNEYSHHYSMLAGSYLADSRIKEINFITAVDLSLQADPQWKAEFGIPKVLALVQGKNDSEPIVGAVATVRFTSPKDARDVLSEWENSGRLWFAEPNRYSKLFQGPTDLFGKLADQYDALGSQISHLSQIKAVEALKALSSRDQSSGPTDQQIREEPPVIAILDSGVDYENVGLKANMWVNDQPGASGCKDDVHGCNTVNARKGVLGDGEVWPIGAPSAGVACNITKCDHGTHVAGLVAGDVNAGFGGSCPVCQIMSVRVVGVVNGEPRVSDEAQIAGMKYIMYFTRGGSNVVRVVNSSFGKYSRSRTVALIISILRRTGKGTIVVAAAGNEDSMSRTYPAALSDAIAVAAVDPFLSKASFSNFGPWVDVSAPGSNLMSTFPGSSQLKANSGTSMSSPVVAGVAGMVIAANPNISFDGLRKAIVNSADVSIYASDLPAGDSSDSPGFNFRNYYVRIPGESAPRPLLGSGLVSIENAVQLKNNSTFISPPLDRVTPNCATISVPRGSGESAEQGDLVALSALLMLVLPVFFALLKRRSHGGWGLL